MTELSVKNAHKIDLDTLNEEQLRKLCAKLIRSRQDTIKAKKNKQSHIEEQVKKQARINEVMMPQVALMMEAIADRAGLGEDPCVRRTIQIIGDQTYTQWSGPVEDLPKLSLDAEPSTGTGADAEMVLSAKIDAHIQTLSDALHFGTLDAPIADAVCGLIDGIDAHMSHAIAKGFKDIDIAWKPSVRHTDREAIETSPAALHELLSDMAMNIDFGTRFLRLDLRAGMYRHMVEDIFSDPAGGLALPDTPRSKRRSQWPKNPNPNSPATPLATLTRSPENPTGSSLA